MLGYKDNLINIVLQQQGLDLFDGCTGFGCGAAFNFVALLPDGELHACRKFPSPIGNILEKSLEEIYTSDLAEQYRTGSRACGTCQLRPFCGGCLAVTHGMKRKIFEERDPFCFLP